MKLKLTKQQIFSLIIIAGLIVGLVASLILVRQRQITQKKAASASVTLSLLPSTQGFSIGEIKTYELWANFTNGSATEKLLYFKTRIDFPKDYFEVSEPIDVSPSQLNQIIRVEMPSVANQTGVIFLQISAIIDSDPRPSTDQPMKIAILKFRAKTSAVSGQPYNFTIDKTVSEVTNNDRPDPVQIPINDPQNATATINAAAITPTVTLTPSPTGTISNPTCTGLTINNQSSVTASAGQIISLRVNGVQNTTRIAFGATSATNPQCSSVSGGTVAFGTVDVPQQTEWLLNYTIPTSLSIGTYTVYANPSTTSPVYVCTSNPAANVSNNYCTANADCNCTATLTVTSSTVTPNPTTTPTQVIKVGTINFRAKTGVNGTATIDYRIPSENKVIEKDTAADIVGTLSNLVLTIGAGGPTIPPGTPIINFRVKFRPVTSDVGTLPVIVRVKKDSLFKEFTNIQMTHQGNGVYGVDNVALVGVPAGTGYKIYVKGPKHLAKGFADISLAAGANSVFDWTTQELEPGDLPPQDGVINSQDISRLIELLGLASPTSDQLNTGDLNYDGVINGGDTNEMILTLSTKFDEDQY